MMRVLSSSTNAPASRGMAAPRVQASADTTAACRGLLQVQNKKGRLNSATACVWKGSGYTNAGSMPYDKNSQPLVVWAFS